jgi:dihydroneopterin aldolase
VLRDLLFRGRHGVLKAERELGQRFEVDLILQTDHSAAAASDSLESTINYAEVYEQAKSVVEGPPRRLIETVAVDLAREVLLCNPRVDTVAVTLRKPQVPIHGILAYAAVEVTRNRGWLLQEGRS